MRIVVLVKQVPQNAQAVFRPDNTMDRAASVKGMNPADRCALLHAAALAGAGDVVTALSMGPASAEETLREAVALGAQEAILLQDGADGELEAERLTGEGRETVRAPLPAVVTVMENLDVTALPSLRGLRAAARAEIAVWDRAALHLDEAACGLSGSATRVVKSYTAQTGLRRPLRLSSPEEGCRAILAGLERRA